MNGRAAARRATGPWLRGTALAAALALHAGVLAALLWRPAPALPPPPPLYGVPLVFAGVAGPDAEGAGAEPPPSAPPAAAPSPPDPTPPEPAQPEPPAPAPPVPAEASPPAPVPLAPASPMPAPPGPVPPAPADAPSPEPVRPAPPPRPAVPPPPEAQRAAAPPMPLPPPAPPPPPDAAPGAIRLGAGLALTEAQPGPDRAAARPREVGCNDATEYPPALAQAGIGGDVLMRLRLTDKGRVIEARVVQSSGHAELDAAAQRGVRRCRFEPALRDGVPVWSSRDWRTTFRPTAG